MSVAAFMLKQGIEIPYRLEWKSKEQQEALQTEVSQRQQLAAEVSETMQWLRTVRTEMEQPASATQLEQQLQHQHALQQEVQVRMAQLQQFIEHDARYATLENLPAELQQQV